MLKMIICVDNNYGIGLNNSLPWNIKEELEHFKETTLNSIVVMGKNTFLSIGKLLPNRKNIIFSRNRDFYVENAMICSKVEEIIELSKTNDVWIIGGKQIYELFIDYVDEVVLSKLKNTYECDTFFNPKLLKFFKTYKVIKNNEFNIYYYKSYKNKILNGLECSNSIINELILENQSLIKKYNKIPKLVIILIGNDFASSIYVNKKVEFSKKIGINTEVIKKDTILTNELINLIKKLNNDLDVNGILVQSPLPNNIDINFISKHIDPLKDVDCFNPINFGKFFKENSNNIVPIPCTPLGIFKLLEYYNIDLTSKNVVVIGRSNIVGKPLIPLLLNKNATVQICHSKTNNLKELTIHADIIISAIGKPNFINKEYIKKDSVLIDVGINRDKNNKLCGDIDFYDCLEKCSYISPVPNGVGPMTLTMLFFNLIQLYKKQK